METPKELGPIAKAGIEFERKAATGRPPQWMAQLDERTNKHIAFARNYAEHYAHGAPGHLDLTTIAWLATYIDFLFVQYPDLKSLL
jgi:hypothetical protein